MHARDAIRAALTPPASGALVNAAYVVRQTQPLERADPVSRMDVPRLIFVLRGQRAFTTHAGGRTFVQRVRPGEGFYIPPKVWLSRHYERPYESVGIVFQPDFTRFILVRRTAAAVRKKAAEPSIAAQHHAAAAWDAQGRALGLLLERHPHPEPAAVYTRDLLEALLLHAREKLTQAEPGRRGKAMFTWRAACQYIDEHLETALDRETLARALDIHPNHVSRLAHRFGGCSFNAYVRGVRLDRAQEWLADPRLTVAQIAARCGFSGANYFVRCYRQRFGRPPGASRGSAFQAPSVR